MVKNIPLTQKSIDKIDKELVGKKITSYQMIIFGSWAKNRAKRYSDIDLAIVSPNFGKDYVAENMMLRRITTKIDDRIEPIAISNKDLSEKYSFISAEIRKTGKVIKQY